MAIYFHALEETDHPSFVDIVARLGSEYKLVGSPSDYVRASGATAWLSFDDNYQSWYRALPLFERLDVAVTFYVNTSSLRDVASPETIDGYYDLLKYCGDRTPLSTTELIDIAAAGHRIGLHTHTHRNLSRLPPAEQQNELSINREILDRVLNQATSDMSFPFGMRRHFPAALKRWCIGNGIETIAWATPAMLHAEVRMDEIHRSLWRFERPMSENWENLAINGKLFTKFTGRSAVG